MAKFKKSELTRAAQIHAALGVRWRSAEPCASCVTRAGYQVVVDHAGRLHEGIDDRGSAKLEAEGLELLRNSAREFRLGGNFGDRLVAIDDRPPAYEIPEQASEAGACLFHLEPGAAPIDL